MKFNISNKQAGYTVMELMVASAVGSIIVAAAYASYGVVAKQFTRISAYSDVQERGMPTIRLVDRDLRMAGYKAVDANLDSTYGSIATPITITDSGDACCDTLTVVYDKSTTERRQVVYYTQARTNPDRTALYMDINLWDGGAWVASSTQSLVTDYVDDFQVVGSDNDGNGNPRMVDVSLVIRGKDQLPSTQSFSQPAYAAGNYTYSFSDNYYREGFWATTNIKNLRNAGSL